MAAYEQGNDKFWAFHDKLFAHQDELGPALYDDVARQVGLDLDRFHASIEAHRNAAAIQADIAAGNAAGANGTPTFFINGHKLVGAVPIEQFKQAIDAELSAQVANK
jgi:protein-disulfide isomerase